MLVNDEGNRSEETATRTSGEHQSHRLSCLMSFNSRPFADRDASDTATGSPNQQAPTHGGSGQADASGEQGPTDNIHDHAAIIEGLYAQYITAFLFLIIPSSSAPRFQVSRTALRTIPRTYGRDSAPAANRASEHDAAGLSDKEVDARRHAFRE